MKLQSELAVEEILKFIKSDSYEKEHPVVIVVSEKGALKNFVFEYYRMIENYQFKIFFMIIRKTYPNAII